METGEREWLRGSGGGKNEEGTDTTLRDTVMVNVCYHTFVHTPRTHTAKREPACKLWTPAANEVSV